MERKRTLFLRGIIYLILGIFIAVQIKTIKAENNLTSRQKDLKTLQQYLVQETDRTLALEEQLRANEKKIADIESNLFQGNGVEKLRGQLDQSRFYAGLTDVSGPGVVVTLDDSKKRNVEGVDPNDTVIHDGDLILLVNLLKSSGAQAISINNERLVSTSEIQCAGPTVSVNGVRYAVPFSIAAIGDADYLEATLKAPGNILDLLSIYGIQVSIKKDNNLFLPKYKG